MLGFSPLSAGPVSTTGLPPVFLYAYTAAVSGAVALARQVSWIKSASAVASTQAVRVVGHAVSFAVSSGASLVRRGNRVFQHGAATSVAFVRLGLRGVSASTATAVSFVRQAYFIRVMPTLAATAQLIASSSKMKIISAYVTTASVIAKALTFTRVVVVTITPSLTRVWQLPRTVVLTVTASWFVSRAVLVLTAYVSTSSSLVRQRVLSVMASAGAMVAATRGYLRVMYRPIAAGVTTAVAAPTMLRTLVRNIAVTKVLTAVLAPRGVNKNVTTAVATQTQMSRFYWKIGVAFPALTAVFVRVFDRRISAVTTLLRRIALMREHLIITDLADADRTATVPPELRSVAVPEEPRTVYVAVDDRKMTL